MNQQKINVRNIIGEIEALMNYKYEFSYDRENDQIVFKEFEDDDWQRANQRLLSEIELFLVFTSGNYTLDQILNFYRTESSISVNNNNIKSENIIEYQITKIVKQKIENNSQIEPLFGYLYTGQQLLERGVQHIPYLIEGLFQKYGLIALGGGSDVGKSSLLRQIATAIVNRDKTFLGFKINAEFNRVIYVSTEDDDTAISNLLNKQNVEKKDSSFYFNLGYIFDTTNLLQKLEDRLKGNKVDCIIIDAFADLYPDDMNMSNKVRLFIYKFQRLAIKYKTLFIFLHHTRKGSQNTGPSKDNLLGSQGFEAKMRLVIELRKDSINPELRYLCFVKGNYLPESIKKDALVLKFDENMRFTNLNRTIPLSDLVQSKNYQKPDNRKAQERAKELRRTENLSYRIIADKLNEEGFNVKKSTVANWLKDVQQQSGLYFYVNPEDCITAHLGEDNELLSAS